MKTRNWKRTLALLTAAAMAATSAPAVLAEEAGEELEYVKLKAISVGDANEQSDFFLEKLNELLLRDLNCELEIENLSWSDWKDKYSLCFASGEDFDFIFTASWAFYNDQAIKDGFYKLTPEDIETYMPLTNAAVGDKWNQTKVNGKIFMIPETYENYSAHDCFAVRGDLMAEAGLEEITTIADMEKYLDTAIANHPELNVFNVTGSAYTSGSAIACELSDDEIIKTYYNSPDYSTPIAGGATLLDVSDLSNLKWVDQETVASYYTTVYNKAKELREKGYWSSDCLSATTAIEEYYKAGNGISVLRQLIGVFNYNIQAEEVLADCDTHIVRLSDKPFTSAACTANGVGIHSTSKNPERTMMVIDKLGYDQEYVDLMIHGIEGEHYTLDENGNVIKNVENLWKGQPTGMGFNTNARREDAFEVVTDNYTEYNEIRAWAKDNNYTPVLTTFNFDNSAVVNEVAAISALVQQYQPILCTGMAEDVEATYNEYMAALDAAGLETVKEEYIRQAQEYVNSLQ